MKTLAILFLALFTTTLLSAQSLSISYNNTEFQRVENGVKQHKVVIDNTVIVYDFDNKIITITCQHDKVITIIDAVKTTEEVYGGETVQLYTGTGSISGSEGSFSVVGGYSDTQSQILLGDILVIYSNVVQEGRI